MAVRRPFHIHPSTHLHTQAHPQVNVCNQRNNGKQENKCTHVPHRCATYIYIFFLRLFPGRNKTEGFANPSGTATEMLFASRTGTGSGLLYAQKFRLSAGFYFSFLPLLLFLDIGVVVVFFHSLSRVLCFLFFYAANLTTCTKFLFRYIPSCYFAIAKHLRKRCRRRS